MVWKHEARGILTKISLAFLRASMGVVPRFMVIYVWVASTEVVTGQSKPQYYALMRYIQFPKTSFSTLMLFKSFEKQANISPFSTLNSIGSASDQDLSQDKFQLARATPRPTGIEEAQMKGKAILTWLAAKGVCAGYPELLVEELNELRIKKVISLREKTTKQPPSLLERRLSKKLAINA